MSRPNLSPTSVAARRIRKERLRIAASFVEDVTALMAKHGITAADLAEHVGVTPAAVRKHLRGKTNLTLESMVSLALGVKSRVESVKLTDAGDSPAKG